MATETPARGETMRVSTIELFFDLVFVFTITQVTHLVAHVATVWELGRALLVLTLIWWMFSAYAWLTNSTRPGHFMPKTLRWDADAAGNVLPICQRRLLTNRNERSDESIKSQRRSSRERRRESGVLAHAFEVGSAERALARRAIGHDRAGADRSATLDRVNLATCG